MIEAPSSLSDIDVAPQKKMASMRVLASSPLANTLFDDPKTCKKKKSKKQKKEKLDKQKSKSKGTNSLRDYGDICDSNLFAEWLKLKKKKRKKKPDISLNKELLLPQNKKLKLSKRHKQNRKSDCSVDTHTVEPGVRSLYIKQEPVQPILSSLHKEKKHKKRVVFNLSPLLLEPKPSPFTARETQRSGGDKKSSFNTVFPADGRQNKPARGENGTESQSTSDDINSQDLFITQKSFSDHYIDLCISTSAQEALEASEGYTEPSGQKQACSEPQSSTASSPWKQSSPEPQTYTSAAAKKQTSPEPQSSTALSRWKRTSLELHTCTLSSPQKWSCPEYQTYKALPAKKQTSPEPQSSIQMKQKHPEVQTWAASLPRRRSNPEPQIYTASSPRKQTPPEHQTLPKKSCPAHHPSRPKKPSYHLKHDASTQTENFFTSPLLATSLRLRRWRTCTEEPLDLSLPSRTRLHQPNITDQMQSSDSDTCLKGKADLSHLKVIQTRLNESFFFKLKGECDSPKPRSPLMKFAGSVEKKKA